MCCWQAAALAGLPGAASAERPVTSAPPRPGKPLPTQAPATAGDAASSASLAGVGRKAVSGGVEVAPDVLAFAPWAARVVSEPACGRRPGPYHVSYRTRVRFLEDAS